MLIVYILYINISNNPKTLIKKANKTSYICLLIFLLLLYHQCFYLSIYIYLYCITKIRIKGQETNGNFYYFELNLLCPILTLFIDTLNIIAFY